LAQGAGTVVVPVALIAFSVLRRRQVPLGGQFDSCGQDRGAV